MTQALAAVAGVTLTALVVLGLVVVLVVMQDWTGSGHDQPA